MYECNILDKTEIPNAPTRKHVVMAKVAFFGVRPPVIRYFFADGSMLYKEEKIMTPKDKLNPVERKVLLSWILKFFLPGNCRTIKSTHIIDAPNVHAMPLTTVIIHPRASLSSAMVAYLLCDVVVVIPSATRVLLASLL